MYKDQSTEMTDCASLTTPWLVPYTNWYDHFVGFLTPLWHFKRVEVKLPLRLWPVLSKNKPERSSQHWLRWILREKFEETLWLP